MLMLMFMRIFFLLNGLLFVIFIVLKFTDNIKWSWIWVISPCWISIITFILLIIGFMIMNRIDEHKRYTNIKPVMMKDIKKKDEQL